MIEAIKKRISVRTYQKKGLLKDDELKVMNIIEDVKKLKGPFGHSISFFFYDTPRMGDLKSQIGTYGFIKNYKSFIVGKIEHSFEALVDFGFIFEHLILRLTAIDLGTCWLGGTFNRSVFDQTRQPHEIVPAITPVGYPNEKKSIHEKIVRRASQGDLRKPFDELFYHESFHEPLDPSHPLSSYLELVRIGPSASNKQPWRCIVDDGIVHFYLQRTKDYGKMLPYDIQALDIGIAICHFTVGLDESNQPYQMMYHKDLNPTLELVRVLSIKVLQT